MDIVKLGKKRQVSIPREVLRRLGLEGDVTMLVDTTPGSNGRAPFRLAAAGRIRLICSRCAMAEAARNIALKSLRVRRRVRSLGWRHGTRA